MILPFGKYSRETGRIVGADARWRDAMIITIPGMRLVNTLNMREHWAAKARRAKRERQIVGYSLLALNGLPRPKPPCVVIMKRFYAGDAKPFDEDGLSAAFKHVRDQVAVWLGVDDAERFGVTWVCRQVRCDYNGVKIEIEEK